MNDLRTRAAEGQRLLRASVERAAAAEPAPAPDVSQSGITADPGAPVGVAWARTMAEVQWIKKEYNAKLNYEIRGIDAVFNAVGPALRKHGVSVNPISMKPTYERVTTKSGAAMSFCKVTVQYAVLGPTGDILPITLESVGEAFDSGDKSTAKAVSVATRVLYLNTFAIPTNRPEDDPEYQQHELAAPPPPTPDEYYAMIANPNTSLLKLQEIRRQFKDHPDTAIERIEEPDGESRTLADILTREGRRRQAASERAEGSRRESAE